MLKRVIIFLISVLFSCVVVPPYAFASPLDGLDGLDAIQQQSDEINMLRGELVSVKVSSLTRVSVTDPEIADIADATNEEVLLVGKNVGQTPLFIWDEGGKRTVMVYVFNQSLDIVKTRLEKLFKAVDIHEIKVAANEQEGKVIVSGVIPVEKKEQYEQIIVAFADAAIDLVTEEKNEDLVQLDMYITEMNTSVTKSLGIDWFTGKQTVSGSSVSTTYGDDFNPVYGEILPSLDGSVRDYFRIGDFYRASNSALVAQISALVTEGKARVISKPKLVVVSGEEARFLVGGEIPIRTTTVSSSGSSQENVEFKEFGVSMTMTPTIKKSKIDILMNLEVSEIDASTATSISEDVAFATRSASTRLLLDEEQTIVLAGMIKHLENETVRKIPFLGDIPIVGLLFRSKANPVPQTDQELVIALTPYILRQTAEKPTEPQTASMDEGSSYMPPRGRGSMRPRSFSREFPPYYMGISQEMTGYVHDVQERISRAIVYPREAREYGWEGTVKLGVLILRDGTLAFALVKESSGREVFDEVAVNTAKRLAPFSAFPSDTDLKELSITIPIVYSLGR